jgi:hypothetical protein
MTTTLTTPAPQSLKDDIAFMRTLAEAGRAGPFRGEALIAAGLIYGAASLYQWSVMRGLWRPPGGLNSLNWVWLGASVLFFGLIMAWKRGAAADCNRVILTAWSGIGVSIWTICLGMGLAAWRLHDGRIAFLIAPVVLALYGSGWIVAAAVYRVAWTRWMGLGCLTASLMLAGLAGLPEQFLAFAIALLVFASAPGFVLARQRARA